MEYTTFKKIMDNIVEQHKTNIRLRKSRQQTYKSISRYEANTRLLLEEIYGPNAPEKIFNTFYTIVTNGATEHLFEIEEENYKPTKSIKKLWKDLESQK